MENAITAGLSKQIVLARALDVAANNIANQTTAGFKSDRLLFREYLTSVDHTTSGDSEISLVYDPDGFTDFAPGGLEATYGDLDFAVDGDGFFAVQTAEGVRYTRDGRFTVDAFGELVDRNGARVLDEGGAPILIDVDLGPILMSEDGELQQDGAPIARLGVFEFTDRRVLRKVGDNLFASPEDPAAAERSRVRQGFIETSNVAPIVAMTDMIDILRAYERAAKVVETADQLARDAVQTLSERV